MREIGLLVSNSKERIGEAEGREPSCGRGRWKGRNRCNKSESVRVRQIRRSVPPIVTAPNRIPLWFCASVLVLDKKKKKINKSGIFK